MQFYVTQKIAYYTPQCNLNVYHMQFIFYFFFTKFRLYIIKKYTTSYIKNNFDFYKM